MEQNWFGRELEDGYDREGGEVTMTFDVVLKGPRCDGDTPAASLPYLSLVLFGVSELMMCVWEQPDKLLLTAR